MKLLLSKIPRAQTLSVLTLLMASNWVTGCTSTPPLKTQAYAKLSHKRTFEAPFPDVWQAIERSLQNYKVLKQDSDDKTDGVPSRKASSGVIQTDWVYGQSRDKYQEYSINGSPRKIELPARFKYQIKAKSILGGTQVTIETSEEVEKVHSDGSPAAYSSTDNPDPSRASELLDKIQLNLLSKNH